MLFKVSLLSSAPQAPGAWNTGTSQTSPYSVHMYACSSVSMPARSGPEALTWRSTAARQAGPDIHAGGRCATLQHRIRLRGRLHVRLYAALA